MVASDGLQNIMSAQVLMENISSPMQTTLVMHTEYLVATEITLTLLDIYLTGTLQLSI